MQTPQNVLALTIGPELATLQSLSELELWNNVQGWFEENYEPTGRFSGDWRDRTKAFIEQRVEPVLRRLGVAGEQLIDQLRDPKSAYNKDNVAALVLALSVSLGWQNLDISTAVSIVILLIKMKSEAP